jgi:hypothetical protein
MDTSEAAARLGTTPRTLRQFLRSPMSTFVAVGSGSRYEFTEQDIPTLQKRFTDWRSGNKTAVPTTPKLTPAPRPATPTRRQPSKKDRAVWEEEGVIRIDDIRNPRVRARVKANAQAAENRLMMLLMSRGLHVTQLGDQRKATA